jgi:predicted RNA-binding protein with PIN domain
MGDLSDDDAPARLLPAAVRERVVALAAERLSTLPPEHVPAALRPVARFTPAKLARLAAASLAACVETDPVFRQHVVETATQALPALAEAVRAGTAVPTAPPADVGALAHLLRPEGWQALLAAVAERLEAEAQAAAAASTADTVARLTEQLDAVRAAGRAQAERARGELEAAHEQTAEARREVAALRRRVRELGDRAARAERAGAAGAAGDDQADVVVPPPQAPSSAEVRRLRGRLAEAEAALAAIRAGVREGRKDTDLRLRVLLDAVVGAAAGLRRELALPPLTERPADAVAAVLEVEAAAPETPLQGRADDDPALLDALLGAPSVHLLVDGYNVTKTGYGEQTLEVQRSRLLAGLGALAARTGAETTVVFDGVDRTTPLAVPVPRGVRLLFSRTGETADDVLRRLVRAEPAGRPLVVVTGDRAVVDDVRADGARTVASRALLRLLER